jgi:lysophospholipase L1-like esterase
MGCLYLTLSKKPPRAFATCCTAFRAVDVARRPAGHSATGVALPRVFVIGDSISLHYGPYLEKYLRGKWSYARKPGRVDTINSAEGANAGDSDRVLEYVRQQRTTIAADWILLNCGLHDVKRNPGGDCTQVPRARYRSNLEEILRLLQPIARVAWVRTTPVNEALHNAEPRRKDFDRYLADVIAYNQIADELMAHLGVPSIDLHGFTDPFMPEGSYDGVHFNDDVRRRQAVFLAGKLETLAQAPPKSRTS